MGEGKKGEVVDTKGIVGIDPDPIEGEADVVRQGRLVRQSGDEEDPTLAEVWRSDESRAAVQEVTDELGSAASRLALLTEAFPGATLLEDEGVS